jgi:hypothetical protein
LGFLWQDEKPGTFFILMLVMKKKYIRHLIITGLLACSVSFLYGWGFWAHQRISRSAVFALPREMGIFFYNHLDFMAEESLIPDVRIYAINDKAEANRHYIDLEYLRKSPAEVITPHWKEAVKRYGDSLLNASGILPWYIDSMMNKLTKAFKDRNKSYILFLSADLGHYLADAHVPLHTTANHNGQLTGQRGIHSFWESYLPEKFGHNYNFYTGDARYIPDVKKEIWRIIEESHTLVDSVLTIHRNLNNQVSSDMMYQKDSTGKQLVNRYNQPVYTVAYGKKYHDMLNGMVERQMRKSIMATANFWFTAWVNAGKPDMTSLDAREVTKRNSKHYKSDIARWKKGKLFGVKTDRDY